MLLKLASTGWRFARYYTRQEAYVEHGAPQLAMRLLAPLFVLATVVLFYSGVAMGFLHGDALPRRALKKAKRTLAAHPQFVAWQDASSETEFGYGLR